jgi:hypothetical protein
MTRLNRCRSGPVFRFAKGPVVTFDERRLITSCSKSSRPARREMRSRITAPMRWKMAFRSRLSRIVDYGPEGNVDEIMQRSCGA